MLAEREGFEPPIPVKVCLISSQVHSTGLCHLSVSSFGPRSPALVSLVVNKLRLQCVGRICGCRPWSIVILCNVRRGASNRLFSGCVAQTKLESQFPAGL
jgi:hypothetical protein